MNLYDVLITPIDNLLSSTPKSGLKCKIASLREEKDALMRKQANIYNEFERQDEEIRHLREELKTERAKTRRSAVIEETGLPPCKSALCKSCKYAATATDEDGRFMLGCIKALNGCYEKDERAARIEELEKELQECRSRELLLIQREVARAQIMPLVSMPQFPYRF